MASVTTYVYDGDKSKAENGTALQAAIDAAAESGIDTLKVQAGTYYGNFTMKQGVNVSGGWDANFETQTDYATILDAQENGRVVNQEAAFDVLTVWENLTIQNGNVTGTGAGVQLCANGKLLHCTITNNVATTQGGGIYCDDTNAGVIIDDCIVSSNTAYQGGGMRIRGTVQNSIVENNTTTDAGGGIHLQAATANNCIVRNNTAKAAGGIRAYGGTVKNCIIEDNSTTTSNTGGVSLQNGAQMQNSIIRNNTSGENTGGVRMTFDSSKSCKLANCLIVGNSAAQTIGGISLEGGIHYVFNNTIVNNSQTYSSNTSRCGVRLNVGAALQFASNIIWGNKANGSVQNDQIEINSNYLTNNAALHFLNNAICHNNTAVGTGTIQLTNSDPGFVDAANADYSLLWTLSLVDAGNDSKAQGTTDLAGKARKAGNHVDIGAYELPYHTLTVAAFEHATLTVGGETKTAGDYSLPKGYTTTATIEPDENYSITSVTCGDAILTPEAGIYTLPALLTDMTLTITVQSTPTGIDDANTAVKAVKVIRNGQLLILRDGKEFNVLGSQL